MVERKNAVLIGVVVALVVTVAVLGVLVMGQLRGSVGEVQEAAPVSSSSAVVSAPVSSATAEITTYAVADGTCPSAEGVDFSDSKAVAQRFMEISFCFDSMVDSTMTAGMLRASDLMSSEFREKLVEPERNALQRQWNLAQEHQAYTRPSVSEAGTEPLHDSSGMYRFEQKLVSWLWVGRDGATMDGGYASLQLVLVQEDGRWVVDAVETRTFEAN